MQPYNKYDVNQHGNGFFLNYDFYRRSVPDGTRK